MAGNADLVSILREIRGSAKPGQPATNGIWYELTQADKNGNAGIYGDILAKYGIVTESAGTFDQAIEILENLNVEVTTLPAGSNATSALINGVWQIGIPTGADGLNGIDGVAGVDGKTPSVTLTYENGNIVQKATIDGVEVLNQVVLSLDKLVESTVQANVDVVAVNQAKVDAENAAATASDKVVEINGIATTVSTDLTSIQTDINDNLIPAAEQILNDTNTAINTVTSKVNEASGYAIDASKSAEEAAESVLDAQAVIPQVADLRDLAQMHAKTAEIYKNQTFVKYGEFEEKYIGPYAMAPLVDPQGDPLVEGAMYWNTTVKKMYVWNGVKWDNTLEVAMIPELRFSIDSNGNLVVDTVRFAEDGEYIEWSTI